MKLIFASSNKNKFIEIEKIIPKNIELGNLKEINFFEEIPENEDTIEGNATFKAKYIHSKFNINVFADRKNVGIWHKRKVENKIKIEKIAAIGIKVKKWIAYHGFALNISNA